MAFKKEILEQFVQDLYKKYKKQTLAIPTIERELILEFGADRRTINKYKRLLHMFEYIQFHTTGAKINLDKIKVSQDE